MNQPLRLAETDYTPRQDTCRQEQPAKPLRELATVHQISLYNQLDFHRAASVTESESSYDNGPLTPTFINLSPIDLGGPQSANDICEAISPRFDAAHTPHLIGLRQRIFAEAQKAGLYECEMDDLGVYGHQSPNTIPQ